MKSQVSAEFFIFVGLAAITITLVIAGLSLDTQQIKWERQKAAAADIGRYLQNEINTAAKVNDGYTRLFTLPGQMGGFTYSISGSNSSIIVNISGKEFSYPVPAYIGNFTNGTNKIDRQGGIIYVNVI